MVTLRALAVQGWQIVSRLSRHKQQHIAVLARICSPPLAGSGIYRCPEQENSPRRETTTHTTAVYAAVVGCV